MNFCRAHEMIIGSSIRDNLRLPPICKITLAQNAVTRSRKRSSDEVVMF